VGDTTWAISQRIIALVGMVLLAPILGLLALAVRLDSAGPILYRARRMERHREFAMLKFRTMRSIPGDEAPAVTALGDPRITKVGRLLRRSKLDELPQLWNVVRGEMLLVGPRPEDPRYADPVDPLHQLVFAHRPGITGTTALAFRDEESLLASEATKLAAASGRGLPTSDDIDRVYRQLVLPAKLAMDSEYLRTRSTRGDLAILGRTVGQVLRPSTRR
jgi:lipopolysaccharide/colanic/teichoic acid biosynthesis glycosyltransferase